MSVHERFVIIRGEKEEEMILWLPLQLSLFNSFLLVSRFVFI